MTGVRRDTLHDFTDVFMNQILCLTCAERLGHKSHVFYGHVLHLRNEIMVNRDVENGYPRVSGHWRDDLFYVRHESRRREWIFPCLRSGRISWYQSVSVTADCRDVNVQNCALSRRPKDSMSLTFSIFDLTQLIVVMFSHLQVFASFLVTLRHDLTSFPDIWQLLSRHTLCCVPVVFHDSLTQIFLFSIVLKWKVTSPFPLKLISSWIHPDVIARIPLGIWQRLLVNLTLLDFSWCTLTVISWENWQILIFTISPSLRHFLIDSALLWKLCQTLAQNTGHTNIILVISLHVCHSLNFVITVSLSNQIQTSITTFWLCNLIRCSFFIIVDLSSWHLHD